MINLSFFSSCLSLVPCPQALSVELCLSYSWADMRMDRSHHKSFCKLRVEPCIWPPLAIVGKTEKMNDSLQDFVLLSESSARANLIRIASGRNT